MPEKAYAAAGNLSVSNTENVYVDSTGQSVTLTVNVSDDDMSAVTYDWYYEDSNSSKVSLGTSSSCSFIPNTLPMKVFCEVSDGSENQLATFHITIRNDFKLTYSNPPSGRLNSKITLSVKASAINMQGISYIWQKANDTSGAFEDIAGAESNSYQFTLTQETAGDYRCHAVDSYGNVADAEFTVDICRHSWNSGVVTIAATYDYAGLKKYTCLICGETRTEIIPAKTVTKNASVTYGILKYKVSSVGSSRTVSLLGPASARSSIIRITIPASIKIGGNSYKVTSISANAFKNCVKLKSISIKTANLKSVGKNALKGINKKAKIRVPKKKLKAYKKLFTKKTGYKKTMKRACEVLSVN